MVMRYLVFSKTRIVTGPGRYESLSRIELTSFRMTRRVYGIRCIWLKLASRSLVMAVMAISLASIPMPGILLNGDRLFTWDACLAYAFVSDSLPALLMRIYHLQPGPGSQGAA